MKKLLGAMVWICFFSGMPAGTFLQQQLKFSRVKAAWQTNKPVMDSTLKANGLNENGLQLFVRVFKIEGQLELWGKSQNVKEFKLLKTFDICANSGVPGPKRKEGDLQVPEGFYQINIYNAVSQFHLALGINYPNASDRILSNKKHPGGDIYIHGKCCTIGCIPLTDGPIGLLYSFCVRAVDGGQKAVPVHIFPCRFNGSVWESFLKLPDSKNDKRLPFWTNIKKGFDYFEEKKWLPKVTVDTKGGYLFN